MKLRRFGFFRGGLGTGHRYFLKVKEVTVTVLLVLSFRWAIAEPYYIPSESMAPTLKSGDLIVASKIELGLRLPFTRTWVTGTPKNLNVGDVVIFKYPGDGVTNYVKRIAGLAGDQVELTEDGNLFVNNVLIRRYSLVNRPLAKVRVPDGHVLVLGDNINNSSDSRVWGFLPRENILGHAQFKWFSWVE